MNWGDIMSPLAAGDVDDVPILLFLIEREDGERIIADGSCQRDHVPEFILGRHRTSDLEVPDVLRRNGDDPTAIKKEGRLYG